MTVAAARDGAMLWLSFCGYEMEDRGYCGSCAICCGGCWWDVSSASISSGDGASCRTSTGVTERGAELTGRTSRGALVAGRCDTTWRAEDCMHENTVVSERVGGANNGDSLKKEKKNTQCSKNKLKYVLLEKITML